MATGSTPITLYTELVRLHKEQNLSFKNVITFNLDEYYPIEKDAVQSYYSFMQRHLFNHIDINSKNIHIPNGALPKEQIKEHSAEYELMIEEAGGIDLQILGIGNNGHIGFNEPGSSRYSKTRLTNLDNNTRNANAREFDNISKVPRLALTMGISTIMKSKRILLMAWGQKANIVAKAVEGDVSEQEHRRKRLPVRRPHHARRGGEGRGARQDPRGQGAVHGVRPHQRGVRQAARRHGGHARQA